MKVLLRSTFTVNNESPTALVNNFRLLDGSGLGFEDPIDNTIWEFIRSFIQQHHHPPDISTIKGHFDRTNQIQVSDRLEEVAIAKPKLNAGDFEFYLNAKVEDRKKRLVSSYLQEASEILMKGVEIKNRDGDKEILVGPHASIQFLMDKAHDILTPVTGTKISGDVTSDAQDFLDEYQRVKLDPLAGIGQFTGLQPIDAALSGAKRHELWVHAAFTGHMKSTTMLNWAYNQAVYYGHDSLIFSLEMPYHQVRRILYAMHSRHEKFKLIHPPLDYGKIRDGALSPSEEDFLTKVAQDFNSGYGRIHIEMYDPNRADFTVADVRSRAELVYARNPFKMVFVDHGGLVSAKKWVPSTSERLNEVIRDLKKLSMTFNKGMGIPVVMLFQMSREAYKGGRKARGLDGGNGTRSNYVYNLTGLSYASECVVGDTMIPTKRGLVCIRDVCVGDYVWSSSGWKTVLDTFDQGVRDTWKLQDDCGSNLIGTGNHRVRILQDGDIVWKALQDIQIGDMVVGCVGTNHVPTSNISNDIAYMIGAWHGDGHVLPYGVGYTGNRKEVTLHKKLVKMLGDISGQGVCDYQFESRPGSFDIVTYGSKFKTEFEALAGSRGKEIPACILGANARDVSAFIQGVWDTDGYINTAFTCGVHMKHEKFLRQLQSLLLHQGYRSTLEPTTSSINGTRYSGWNLRLKGRVAVSQFMQQIGFTEQHKMARLYEATCRNIKECRVYPVVNTYIDVLRRYARYDMVGKGLTEANFRVTKMNRNGYVPHTLIQSLLNVVHQPDDVQVQFLQKILSLNVTKVVSCAPTGLKEQVYDIEVNGDHEYQTGPFLSHNCERSADIVTTTWVDEELQQNNQVLYQCLKSRDNAPFEPFCAGVHWPTRRIYNLDYSTLQQGNVAREIELDTHNL